MVYPSFSMIEAFDTVVRLIAAGASLLMLLILLLSAGVRAGMKLPLAGLLLGAIAYLINSSSTARALIDYMALIDIASIVTPLWLWLFARRLFEREPPGWMVVSLLFVYVAIWFTANFTDVIKAPGFVINHIVGLALVADLIRVALSDRSDDLLEKRRAIRLWLPIVIGLQTGGILLVELIVGMDVVNTSSTNFAPLQTINAFLILLLTLGAGLALVKPDPELLAEVEPIAAPSPQPQDNGFSPQEKVLSEKLTEAMDTGFYRTAGLTIALLADHLGTPEHRLRALINQRLGHRNFSSFLNRHRIAEAQQILADRERVDLPVLTIAMDLGYNSLPTFNRAFRSETSETPTDFRRKSISQK